MDSSSTVRARWLAQLLSIEPADRARAEAGIRELYRAAGFPEPRYFVWFDSPFRASWAIAFLLEPHNGLWSQILESAARSDRERIEQIRADLCRALLEPDWRSAVAAAGPPMDPRYSMQNIRQASASVKYLQSEIITARMHFHPDRSVIFSTPDPSDDLVRAERGLWGSASSVLSTQSGCGPTGSLIEGSFYSIYPFSNMAIDEAFGSGVPPALLSAAWNVARSAGPWWPFQNLAVLTDRPTEIHVNERHLLHRGDGPAAIYRDGAKAYAWNGRSLPEQWILQPEAIPASHLKQFPDAGFREYVTAKIGPRKRAAKAKKPSPLLKTKLPREREARLKLLREHAGGRLPLYERYVAGEHKQVWAELMALGPAVRQDPHAADALAVAYETMDRVAANVRTLLQRLKSLNYRFHTEGGELDQWTEQAQQYADIALPETVPANPVVVQLKKSAERARTMLAGALEAMKQKPRDYTVRAHVPPDAQIWSHVLNLEKQAGTLPLSLRAFYDVVGSVDLMGRHPTLSPGPGTSIASDPLVVASAGDALDASEGEEGELIFISPDDIHKAGESGGSPYEIEVPEARADGQLLNERHNLLFVDYLRLAFHFGGFPGFDGAEEVPSEIETLREGLLEF